MGSNIAEKASNLFSELLNSNEQQYTSLRNAQTSHDVQLQDVQAKLQSLEARCNDLQNDNVNLKASLATANENSENTNSKFRQLENDNAQLKSKLDLFSKCFEDAILKVVKEAELREKKMDSYIQVLSEMVEKINTLQVHTDETEKRVIRMEDTQASVTNVIRRQQHQLTAAFDRINASNASQRYPIAKSPSASAFLRSSSPNFGPKSHHFNRSSDNYAESLSFNPADEFSELTDYANQVMRGVEALQRNAVGTRESFSGDNSSY